MTTGGDTTTMTYNSQDTTQKPATAARIYDYYLGGIHNFPADQAAAKTLLAQFPCIPAVARANRAFMRRAVRRLVDAGIRQFLDIGSGIPTAGNVHEIAQAAVPDTRVVYVDIDPMAVAESLEILEGNKLATAVRADVRTPEVVLDHPGVQRLLDLGQPVGLLLVGVLHFVPEDAVAYEAVARFVDALAPGSYVVVSHAASEAFEHLYQQSEIKDDVYRQRTPTPGTARTRPGVERFFTGLKVMDPGVVLSSDWWPDPDEVLEPDGNGSWVGVGQRT
ncbi:MAG TPA: SAM-dependent methyltransferase [Pilimelia sp.]|nr:SAM-dependent methyltransferase [Pilimelia sp.]